MARTPSIKPKLRKERVKKGLAAWCVNVPPALGEDHKRQQLFFATKAEASFECERIKTRKANFGVSLNSMSPSRIAEAAEAYKLLDASNIKLLDAARGFLEAHKQKSASIPFGELFDLYLAAKTLSKPYRTQLEWAKARLEPLQAKVASEITVREIDAALAGEKITVKNAFMRYLRAVFNWGMKRDYIANNPINKMDFEQVTKGETQIFPASVAQAILDDCLQNDLELLPYRVFGFFCGVRPDGELPRLDWADIDVKDKILKLRAEITKKKRLRFVDISENAIAWLNAYSLAGGSEKGRVAPFTEAELRKHHRDNWARVAGSDEDGKPKLPWIQQGMRHSYCSYWLAEHGDIDALVIQSGHDDQQVMWNNYYRATTKQEAAKFWSIVPPSEASNVVAFSGRRCV
jgi:integrase